MTRFHAVLAFIIVLAILCLAVMAQLAFAQQQPCGPIDKITAYLNSKYGEAPVAGGAVADGQSMMALFANPSTGTWTLLNVTTAGIACVAVSGDGFTAAEYKAPAKGSPS